MARAAAIRTRIVKPIISYLASHGIWVSISLDDPEINAATQALAWEHYQITKDVFWKAGFVISAEKSDVFSDVSQQKLYLGFIMCSVTMTARASEEKLSSVFSFIRTFLPHAKIAVKDLAKIAGKIASLCPAFSYFVLLTSCYAYSSNVTLISFVGQVSRLFRWSQPREHGSCCLPVQGSLENDLHTVLARAREQHDLSYMGRKSGVGKKLIAPFNYPGRQILKDGPRCQKLYPQV